jgi:hypothetical protein
VQSLVDVTAVKKLAEGRSAAMIELRGLPHDPSALG